MNLGFNPLPSRRCRLRNWSFVFTFLILGCGPGPEDPVEVTGVVLKGGVPVADANITFHPKSGRSASGVTDADGRFALRSYREGDGAVAGSYTVTVTEAYSDVEYGGGEDSSPYVDPQASQGQNPQAKPLVSERYWDVQSSPLRAEVSLDGENDFTFEIVD